jgi:hypothetical protein
MTTFEEVVYCIGIFAISLCVGFYVPRIVRALLK